MVVTSANASGATALAMIRGAHTISGSLSPLFVLDGVPVSNSSFASTTGQQFGLGGFDYGSPLGDLSLQDIGSVQSLSASDAAPLYGSRGANGVVLITTKNGFGTDGFAAFAQRQSTSENPIRLPQYQNQYGQGLGGQFEFFDGLGGGINDGVAQSWGPPLDGRALAQASFVERERAAVRLWVPDPSGVGNYFGTRSTTLLSGGAQWGGDGASVRGSVNSSTSYAMNPRNKVHRLDGTLAGTWRPLPRLFVSANLQDVGTTARDRPGTGFDDINPVSSFVTMPREVNLDSLRAHLRDKFNDQINWIYTGQNNPTFQPFQNSNTDLSTLAVAGGLAQYQLAPWLIGSVQSGIDHYHSDRAFRVLAGWQGGYPTALGRGDFSGGGTQAQAISANHGLVDLSLSASSSASRWMHGVYAIGFENRSSNSNLQTSIVDVSTIAVGGVTAGGLSNGTQSSSGTVVSLYATAAMSLGKDATLNAGVRRETSSTLPSGNNANLYPSLGGTYDLLRAHPGLKDASHLSSATLRASLWQSGNEVTSQTLANTYAGQGTMLSPIVGVTADSRLRNEQTDGMEIGAALMATRNVGLDLSVYHERSSHLLIAELGSETATTGPSAASSGVFFNQGIEATLRTVLLRNFNGLTWDATTSFAKNINRVDALDGSTTEVPLGPALWGASVVARVGSPVGSIVGRRFLRDGATGALILKNGLPLPDMSGDPSVLGSWQPSGSGSITSTMHYRGVELTLLVDARFGGKIFSATNYWGSYSGTLQATADRPVGGSVIAGIDSATGKANATAVTTEDYYHALGPITEAWVYDASFAKLREFRIGYTYRLTRLPYLNTQSVNVSLVTRNIWTWAKAPNIDPETTLGTGAFQGVEMGQLPNARSVGLRFSIVP